MPRRADNPHLLRGDEHLAEDHERLSRRVETEPYVDLTQSPPAETPEPEAPRSIGLRLLSGAILHAGYVNGVRADQWDGNNNRVVELRDATTGEWHQWFKSRDEARINAEFERFSADLFDEVMSPPPADEPFVPPSIVKPLPPLEEQAPGEVGTGFVAVDPHRRGLPPVQPDTDPRDAERYVAEQNAAVERQMGDAQASVTALRNRNNAQAAGLQWNQEE